MNRRKRSRKSRGALALLGVCALGVAAVLLRAGRPGPAAIPILALAVVALVGAFAVFRVVTALFARHTSGRELPRASELSTLAFPPESRHLRK
jgi:hypothetical protein